MSEQIDWSKAPEGATHYGETGGGKYFYRIPGKLGGQYDYLNLASLSNSWGKGSGSPCAEMLIPRPAPSWSGSGLPPVGVDLQWFSSVYGWIGGKVVAHDEQTTIVRHNDGYEGCYLHNLKPCKTPEQIAADEREAALIELIKDAGKSLATGSLEQAAKIYDAGWRKHPKP